MSNLRDIRFRKKGGLVTIRIKVGDKWIDRSGGWRTIEEATAPAIELRDRLQAEYAATHPVVEALNELAGKKPRKGEKSFRMRAQEEHVKYCKRQRLRDTHNNTSALNYLFKQLGEKADLPPRLLRVRDFTKVRDDLLDNDMSFKTVQLYSRLIREMLSPVSDLNPKCLDELKNLPKKKDNGAIEASGEPFSRHHFKVMFKEIDKEDEIAQLLFWVGASGGPQIVDAVFLQLAAVNWDTGMIRGNRIKTGERFEFRALPPLLELLKKRRNKLGEGAVYFLPELFLKQFQLRDPDANKTGWSGYEDWSKNVPKKIVTRGSSCGQSIMMKFFVRCGIKTSTITYKSFRKHAISFWASLGIKQQVRMRMAGHNRIESHNRYDVPAEFELIRTSQIVWRYYQSILRDEEFFIPTSVYDLYESIMAENVQLKAKLTGIETLCQKMATHLGLV